MTKADDNSRDSSAIRPARILHAESDRVVARSVAAYLGARGHQIESVINGKEALASIVGRPGHYEVLILDHSMPELDGMECARVLRKMGYPGKIIVFASGLPLEIEQQFLTIGVDRILQKTSNMLFLGEAIQELLNSPATTNE